MSRTIITAPVLKTATEEGISKLRTIYPTSEDAEQAPLLAYRGFNLTRPVNSPFLGLKIDPDVETIIQKYTASNQTTMPGFSAPDIGSYFQDAIKGMIYDFSENALKSQKDLVKTITKEIDVLVKQGYTIEKALIEWSNKGPVKIYIEKTTGTLVYTDKVLDQTHIPVGKFLGQLAKVVTAWAIYENLKDPVTAAYDSVVNGADTFTPVKEYAVASAGVIAGGYVAGTLAAGPITLSLALGAGAGLLASAATDALITNMPGIVSAAKLAGKTLAEALQDAYGYISDQVELAYQKTGAAATAFLQTMDGYADDIYDGADQLAKDYGWAWDNPGAVGQELLEGVQGILPPWLLPAVGMGQNNSSGIFGNAGRSPLILDLDGDGVESSNLGWGAGRSTTYFDMDNDGFAERTAWVTGGDGLLALDRNGNGKIDGQSELFGNGGAYADGFAALKVLDTNGDNKITSADTQFANLRVWVDDGDGVTEAGELKTLGSLGITSINLNATAQTNLFNNENVVSHTSTFTMGGQTRAVHDVWFRWSQADSHYQGSVTINPATLFLPTLKGFGNLKDLHVAMSTDGTLLTMVQNFVTSWNLTKFGNPTGLENEVKAILYRWAGADRYADGTKLYGADAKTFTFMEKLTGEKPWWTVGLTPDQNISGNVLSSLDVSFRNVVEWMKAQLIVQTAGSSLFSEVPHYDLASGEIVGNAVLSDATLTAFAAQTAASGSNYQSDWLGLSAFLVRVKPVDAYTTAEVDALNAIGANTLHWNGWTGYVLSNFITSGITGYILNGTDRSDLIGGNIGSDQLWGSDGNDLLYGQEGGDGLYGGVGNDELYGGYGNDYLEGNDGNDLLVGGMGDDTLDGRHGDDTYVYEAGLDSITDVGSGSDTLKFADGITLSRLSFVRPDDTTLIVRLDGQQAVTVNYQFGGSGYNLERLAFADNTTVDLAQFRDVLGTTAGETLNGLDNALLKDDVIRAGAGNDTLLGGSGNDRLYGEDGDDALEGSNGDDRMEGGTGNDKYVYASGAGKGTDMIKDASGTADWISLGADYTPANISLVRVGQYDLAIDALGQRRLLIEGQFQSGNSIESIRFSTGTTLNLMTYSHTLNGTAGNDNFYGTSYGAGGDKIYGYGGVDVVYAGAGNDTISGGDDIDVLNGEDGNDTIYGDAGDDWIYAGAGNDIIRGGSGNDLIYGDAGNDTIIYDGGLDMYRDNSGTTDIIQIADAAVTAANITFRKSTVNEYDVDVLINGVTAFTLASQFTQGQSFETLKFANGTTLNLLTVTYPTINGTAGNDTLYGIGSGGNANDTINGLGGNDTLYGYGGNDTLDGGLGTDSLQGGDGNDTYKVNLGQGVDTISDTAGTDTILFGAGLVKSAMTMTRNGDDLNILFGGVLTTIVQSHFSYSITSPTIETLQYADGTTTSIASTSFTQTGTTGGETLRGHMGMDMLSAGAGDDGLFGYGGSDLLRGEDGTDYLYGGSGNDTLDGGNGADTLSGEDGNDTLTGGAGNDQLYGGIGDDTYSFATGAGIDSIYDDGGTTDTIKFGTGITAADIRFMRSAAADLDIYAGVNKITVTWQFYDEYYGSNKTNEIEKLILADGTMYNLLSGLTYTGTSVADTVYGSKLANDTLQGLGGNDYLDGYDGNDLLIGGAGSDYLTGGLGADTFRFRTADLGTGVIDTIQDFSKTAGDKLDIKDILVGYDPLTKLITNYLQITDSATSSIMKVDRDGLGTTYTWTQIATLQSVTGLTDEQALLTAGNVVA